MTLDELRQHVAELRRQVGQMESALDAKRAELNAAEAEHDEAARRDMALRPLATGTATAGRGRKVAPVLPVEHVRDAVVKLGTFVLTELAAELECTPAQARYHLTRVPNLVKPDGKVGGANCYAYVPVEGPGVAFEAQRRLQAPAVADGDLAAVQGAEVAQSLVGMVACKELRPVVRAALAEGWRLVNAGGRHHMKLVRDGDRPITIPSTPRNAGDAANRMRRQLRQAS